MKNIEADFKALEGYRDSKAQIEIIEQLLHDIYNEAVQEMSLTIDDPKQYEALANLFSGLVGCFDDAELRSKQCMDSF